MAAGCPTGSPDDAPMRLRRPRRPSTLSAVFVPRTLSTAELRARFEALVAGDPLDHHLADQLPVDVAPVGRGWVWVTALEAAGCFAVTTLPEGPALDSLRPGLARLHGRAWSGAADLDPDAAGWAARLDASLAVEALGDVAARYRVAEAELASCFGVVDSREGLPEVVVGLTVTMLCA